MSRVYKPFTSPHKLSSLTTLVLITVQILVGICVQIYKALNKVTIQDTDSSCWLHDLDLKSSYHRNRMLDIQIIQ